MRTSLLASLALAGAVLLVSFCAQAVPVHVGITAAAGNQSWKSPPISDPSWVNLSAWSWNPQTQQIEAAWMTIDHDANGDPGLGVCATQPNSDNVCTDPQETNQIDPDFSQVIDLDISEFNNWNGLTITLLGFQPHTWGGLLGASCIYNDSNSDCSQAVPLSQQPCSAPNVDAIVTCTLGREDLTALGVSHIWIDPAFGCSEDEENGCSSFLLGAGDAQGLILDLNHETVPEPSALGVFGLGALLLGLFAALRRRQRLH